MHRNLLSYQCLKAVLDHMDANKRFQLAIRIPSIRSADRASPLRIRKLAFDSFGLQCDSEAYQIGIYRKYLGVTTPKIVDEENSKGGVQYDFNQFGFRDRTSQSTVTPGDVVIGELDVSTQEEHTNEQMRELERYLDYYKRSLALLSQSSIQRTPFQVEIEKTELSLEPFICRRDNTTTKYESFIQLTTHTYPIERVRYTKKLYEAMKYLCTLIFGDRRYAIRVKRLEIVQDPMIIRLPVNLSFKVEVVKIGFVDGIKILNALTPIMKDWNVECLECNWIDNLDDINHPAFLNIKTLVISNISYLSPWLTIFKKLQNRKILFKHAYAVFETKYYIHLIKYWQTIGRDIGKIFSFCVTQKQRLEVKEVIKEELGGIEMENGTINVSMNSYSSIEISVNENSDTEQTEQHMGEFTVKMEIVKRDE
ncbi:hypothetical protein GCK72_007355 [Caenorhabditis remanei]|uniref:F-box C protein n=1 Tax=Caenorhabditis remanei TaxID=31234 RepID=A0A6A5HL42_CAERE|nr:hypothetical protein GCK72_007355 [Caenorhabditis remanei]KAF1767396.1 hypothetical protein GCK72_007355 [Caenorhabditis remanei]